MVGERAFEVGQRVGRGGGEEVSARQVTPAQKIGAMLGVVQSVRRAEWLVERTDRSVQSRVMLQKKQGVNRKKNTKTIGPECKRNLEIK